MTTTRRSAATAGAARVVAEVQEVPNGRRSSARISSGKNQHRNDKSAAVEAKNRSSNAMATPTEAVQAKGAKRGKRAREQEPQPDPKEETPAKRPRGRPRKSVAASEQATQDITTLAAAPAQPTREGEAEPEVEPPTKRSGRSGRPSKAAVAATDAAPDAPCAAAESAAATSAALPQPAAKALPIGVPMSTAALPEAAPAAAQVAPTQIDAAPAVAAHQLQLQGGPEPPSAATAPAQPPTASPISIRAPFSPRPQASICLSLQRRVLGVVNGVPPAVTAAAAAAMPAVASPRLALAPRPGAGSPKASAAAAATATAAADLAAAVVTAWPEGALTDEEIVQIRRLLMPGALAGTLASCAAAAAAAGAAAPTDAAAAAALSGGTEGAAAGAPEPAGRTVQFKELYSMVSECCSSGRGSAVYISGLPGTGKTYTVSRLLASLPALASASATSAAAAAGGRVSFCCATLNCMALDDPAQLYGRLQSELGRAAAAAESGKEDDIPYAAPQPTTTDANGAYDRLLAALSKLSMMRPTAAGGGGDKKAGKGAGGKGSRGGKRGRSGATEAGGEEKAVPRRRVFVVVLDEVDRLLRRRDGGEELARLFQLPNTPGLSLILLAVANSLDLTERLMPLMRARGMVPRHLVFTAYSRPQVLAILASQLGSHPRGRRSFDDAALDLVAKSVSSSSGDLRQALKACRTALDVLLDHNRANPAAARASVGLREAHAALQRLSSQGNGQPAVVAKIKGLPPQQQLVLLALATAVGAKAAAAGSDGATTPGCGAIFTGARPKFADAVAFREIGNGQGGGGAAAALASNPGACFEGPTPSKPGRPGGSGTAAGAAATPSSSRVRGVTGPSCGAAAAGTPGGGGGNRAAPPSRTPASILAGDAGLALGLVEVYGQYTALCRQLDIPAMSESAFRTDALAGLDCDGLLRLTEGRTPAATRLSLRAMVRDVQAALADNVMFKRLMGAKAPQPPQAGGPAAVAAVRA